MAGEGTALQGEDRDQENIPAFKRKNILQTTVESMVTDPEIVNGLVSDKCFEKSNTKVLTEVFIK